MTDYQVIVQPEAERNIAAIYDWIAERSPEGARSWYDALGMAIARLRFDAHRFPFVQESPRFDGEIRDLLFKTRRGRPYRLIFAIRESEVHILYVRGPGQDLVAGGD